ncbi:MAG: hypothetical protein Q7J27_03885 [Syntrophales bacterium]|nr:hypothetical protein [Syntrophales bacterium]
MTIFSLRYRTLIFHLAILVFFAGCANGNQCKIDDLVYSESPIIGFVWNTQGGGDMRFAVEREGKHYKIIVERHDFHTINRVIILTNENDEAYRLVDDIFEKRIDLYNYVSVPKGVTGTWTEITLIYTDRRETAIDRIDAVGDLNILYQFVHNAVQAL